MDTGTFRGLITLILIVAFIGIFFWAVRSNQFDDLERQGYSILFDDDLADDKQTEQQDPKSAPPAEQQTKTSTHD
nr:cbb3-type cytochrome oxidase assembly protein CcoS [uncultured Halomonas sp.]